MAASFGLSTIANARPYWLEQIPYTALISTLAAGAQDNLIPAVQSWNPTNQAPTLVALDTLGATQWPGVQIDLASDTTRDRYDLGMWPAALAPVPVDRVARSRISATLTNTNSTAATNLQVTYQMTVWDEPIAVRVLRGWPLSVQDQTLARQIGLDIAPANQRGTLPLSLDRVIENSYRNRLIGSPLSYALAATATPTTGGTPFHRVQVPPNTLYVVRSVGMAATLEDGVQLHIDRDTNTDHVVLDAAALSLNRPTPMFIPALQSLNFRLTATTAPPAPTPVRIEIWPVSLSNILRLRLGLLDLGGAEQIMGTTNGQKLYASVKAGMN